MEHKMLLRLILALLLFTSPCLAGVQSQHFALLARQAAGGAGTPQVATVLPTSDSSLWNQMYRSTSGDATGSAYVEVDDPVGTPDDDTSYLSSPDTGLYQAFNNLPSITSSSVEKVIVHFRCKEVGATFGKARLRVNGSTYVAATSSTLTSSYVDYTYEWSVNPNTTTTWLEADVEGTGSNPLTDWGLEGLGVSASGANEYYGYTPYTYPHPLREQNSRFTQTGISVFEQSGTTTFTQ